MLHLFIFIYIYIFFFIYLFFIFIFIFLQAQAQSLGTEDAETSDRFDAWIPDLPPCELGELENIMKIVVFTTVPGQQRELAVNIESEGYIPKLLDLFHICEDLNNKEGLHHLYHIFKAFFLFNNASLLQVGGFSGAGWSGELEGFPIGFKIPRCYAEECVICRHDSSL